MIPGAWVVLAELPMTPNGKVDRQRLPAPELAGPLRYVAPRTPTEEALARVWADVLKLDQVGIDDDFFTLGGTSLSIMRVPGAVKRALSRDISVVDLFRYPTLRVLAAHLDGCGQTKVDSAKAQAAAGGGRRTTRRRPVNSMRMPQE
jgi:hypothetical protein